MCDEVRENRLQLLPHELLVSAVQLQNMVTPDIIVGTDAEIHLRMNVGHRAGEVKAEDSEGNWDSG